MILVQALLEGWEVRVEGDTEKTYGKGSGIGRGSKSGNSSWWVGSCAMSSEDSNGNGKGKSCGKGNESPWIEKGSSARDGGMVPVDTRLQLLTHSTPLRCKLEGVEVV